ncbi:hypothetical protein NLU13_8277 [Sarocladium strictum]|uniref:Uncharacterized protein n=1 Tax=Sarocladium strictum TaxID=5046 RepID=A0AA39GCT5_SARSR|nr:hypothetical protein NLU13_8277 [Sarocladium strictum]
MAAGVVDSTVMPWVPPVSFAERPELEVKPTVEELKRKGLNRADIRTPEATDFACTTRAESRLLTMPSELRLAVYWWVYLMTPVYHAQLAPWYPAPHPREYVARAVKENHEDKDEHDNENETRVGGRSLSSKRPLCGMPTSLLRANREIYHEARSIPFIHNEFVFVNWFSSGLWAARSFTRLLHPWQLSALRQIRLEVLSRDLMGTGSQELSHICSSLSNGLQGLRLKIAPGGSSLGLSWLKEKAEGWAGDVSERAISWGRVEDGILKLKSLKRLEIEVEVASWGNGEKIAWCRRLEEVLRKGGMMETEVVCVEGVGECREKSVGELLEEMAMNAQ